MFGSGVSAARMREQSAQNEHTRSEKFRDHFERIVLCALYGIAFIFLVLGGVWFWHLVAPEHLLWLSPDDVSRLQNFVTGGVIATIAGGHIKKRLSAE